MPKGGRRRESRGFTLIELMVVVAIVGIIAATLIPALLDAIQRAKQKRTVADVRSIGLAWFSWVTDNAGAPAPGRAGSTFDFGEYTSISYPELVQILRPIYLSEVPSRDGWGHALEFARSDNLDTLLPIGIRSSGRDGVFEGDEYSNDAFLGTDYDRDIVWVGGFFFQYPSGVFGQTGE
jgi:prepilin-type N-terminal cleavage/methylation domain-containing protein